MSSKVAKELVRHQGMQYGGNRLQDDDAFYFDNRYLVVDAANGLLVRGTSPFANPRTEGAKGDGVADDTGAVQASIDKIAAAGGGVVLLDKGNYKLTRTLAITNSGVALVGVGSGHNPNAATPPVWAPAAKLLWAGNNSTPMISFTHVQGCRVSDIGLDGADTALYGIYLDVFQHGVIERVGMQKMLTTTGTGLYATSTSASANVGTSFNTFRDISIHSPQGIYLTGNRPTLSADCCINLFERICCVFGSASNTDGITLDFADNNSFTQVYTYRKAGTGIAVRFGTQARNNFFWHLYADQGVVCETPDVASWNNVIFGYQRGDGALAPTLNAGAKLTYTEDGVNATGWYIDGPKLSIANRDNSGTAELALRGTTAGGVARQLKILADVTGSTIRQVDDNPLTLGVNSLVYASISSAIPFQVLDGASVQLFSISTTGRPNFAGPVQATVGAAGAASALPAQPTGYLVIAIAGTNRVIPYYAAS